MYSKRALNRAFDRVKSLRKIQFRSRHVAATQGNLKSYDEIPGPKQLPFIGSLLTLKQFGGEYDPMKNLDFTANLNKKYGDIVKWSILGTNEIYVYKPEHMKKLMQSETATPSRRNLEPYSIYTKKRNMKEALVNAEGGWWKQARSASIPIIGRPQTVAAYLPKHNSVVNDFIEFLKTHESNSEIVETSFEEKLKLLAVELNSVAAFDECIRGVDPKRRTSEVAELVEGADLFLKLPLKLMVSLPLWKYYPTKDWKKFEAAGDSVYRIGMKYVKKSYERLEKLNFQCEEPTILQQYLLSQQKTKLTLTDILGLSVEVILAGVDTVSTALHYCLYELGRHPQIQEELYAEIQSVCKTDSEISPDHLEKMRFLKLCVKEVLRLNNLGSVIMRTLQEDLVIDNYLIPKGTIVNFCTYFSSRSDRFFKEALQFNPKRWLTDKDTIDSYTSLPFGHGVRSCIGRRIAEQELYLILIKLLQNFCKVTYIGEPSRLAKVANSLQISCKLFLSQIRMEFPCLSRPTVEH